MAVNNKSLISLETDIQFNKFITSARVARIVAISDKTVSWENGLITVQNPPTTLPIINPTIYASFNAGNDRQQPDKPIDSSEYIPLTTITVSNIKEEEEGEVPVNAGVSLDSTITISIKGQDGLEFAPLKIEPRTAVGLEDVRDEREALQGGDTVRFQGLTRGYQTLNVINPDTGRPEASPYYFGYSGIVEGALKTITKDELLIGKNNNRSPLDDGTTKTFTLYGRVFSTEKSPVEITSITGDTDSIGDFKTSDHTLIFNGIANPKSKVEVFLDDKSIGTTTSDDEGNWSYDYQNTRLNDGNYKLGARYEDLRLNTGTAQKDLILEPDTDFDITFALPSNIDPSLEAKIKAAGEFWEKVIVGELPDVGKIDDLQINVSIGNLGNPKELAKTAGDSIKFRTNGDKLPYFANMIVNETTLDGSTPDGQILDTIKHEIGHALGFNKNYLLFAREGDLLTGVGDVFVNSKVGFTGENALEEYRNFSSDQTATAVPIEFENLYPNRVFEKKLIEMVGYIRTPEAGIGHWDEKIFGDEIMTPKLNGRPLFLSPVTIGAFEDMGYDVSYEN
jgi:Bacterial Ig-like domain/Leishmanolysin